jgi:hypothetical protein
LPSVAALDLFGQFFHAAADKLSAYPSVCNHIHKVLPRHMPKHHASNDQTSRRLKAAASPLRWS